MPLNEEIKLVEYIRDPATKTPYGNMVATIIEHEGEKVISVGVAICNTNKDKFSKNEGNLLALNRAKNPSIPYNNLPAYTEKVNKQKLVPANNNAELVRTFVYRCFSYFKEYDTILVCGVAATRTK